MQFYWRLHLNKISTKKLRKRGRRKLNNIQIQQKISSYNDTNHNKLIATDNYLLTEKLIDERKGRLGQLLIIW